MAEIEKVNKSVMIVPTDVYEAMARVVRAVAEGMYLPVTPSVGVLAPDQSKQSARIIWETAFHLYNERKVG